MVPVTAKDSAIGKQEYGAENAFTHNILIQKYGQDKAQNQTSDHEEQGEEEGIDKLLAEAHTCDITKQVLIILQPDIVLFGIRLQP